MIVACNVGTILFMGYLNGVQWQDFMDAMLVSLVALRGVQWVFNVDISWGTMGCSLAFGGFDTDQKGIAR